ncbi:MAG: endospore germination permease [Clostridiales bacterium]|nr:endospore germination permease [Eubacteriales bacterium]MDH7567624.1 endospore germination permease [Clostridiales bacterium]
MEKARISSIQLFLLIIGFLYGSTVIINPALSAKNDAWLAILLGGVGGALLIGVYASIALLNPSKTLVEILMDRFGKLIGNAVSILYIWYFIHIASLVFRNFGEFITTMTFPETPMAVVIGIFAVLLVYGINSGIEVMGRTSELFVPFIPVTALIISLSLITTRDFTAFLPMLENGMALVLNAAFSFITFPFGETIAFLMLFPHLNKKENLKKVAALSVLFIVVLCLFIFIRNISVLGSDLMYRAIFTPHLTSLLIPGLNVEPLIDINLLIGGGTKISVCIYAAAKALSQVLGISDYRKLTTAITTFCVVLSIWVYENVLEMFSWAEKVWPYYSIPFQMVIPLILLFLSLKKRAEPSKSRE